MDPFLGAMLGGLFNCQSCSLFTSAPSSTSGPGAEMFAISIMTGVKGWVMSEMGRGTGTEGIVQIPHARERAALLTSF